MKNKEIKEKAEDDGELRRVLLELSMTDRGDIEVRLDQSMKPITVLALVSSMETLREELKQSISWGGVE